MASSSKTVKLPPFLKKLLDITTSCPPHIGGWNEEGTQFVVKSSQFADLLREQFQGSLQTFVRQLHFYSFTKKDDGARGIWMFSHPHFIRGQPQFLVNIERKSNPKKKTSSRDDSSLDEDDPGADQTPTSSYHHDGKVRSLELRLASMEEKLSRVTNLEKEVDLLKQELVEFKELAAAQNLLALAPEISKKRKEDPFVEHGFIKEKLPAGFENDESELKLLPPPKKVTRMTSVDSVFELKDFPFEDTSSLGSVSMKDLMRELQVGIFADFDEFLPSAQRFTSGTPQPSLASYSSDATSVGNAGSSAQELCGQNDCAFSIPNNFKLQPGVTVSLLKQAFDVIKNCCCPNSGITAECAEPLRNLVEDMPHPDTLPAVELCPINRQLLPVLRREVKEEASDLSLMRASRQVYEVYFQMMMKKLKDKKDAMECAVSNKSVTKVVS